MATIKLKYRPSSLSSREGTLFFHVIHGRTSRQINTKLKLTESEWNAMNVGATVPAASGAVRKLHLEAVNSDIIKIRNTLTGIITRFEQSVKPFTTDDIVTAYVERIRSGGFLSFLGRHIEHLVKSNRFSAARKTRAARNSFSSFLAADDIAFEQVDATLIQEYEGWLKHRNVCLNTSSFYMRTLRTAYNIAVERGLTEQRHPFTHIYTGIGKTVKRAVSIQAINKIRNLELTDFPLLNFARNVFMLSFYLRGMSFVDMCFLKKSNLVGGILSYHRQKTGQLLLIKWEKPMQKLLETFGKSRTKYLLPIITDTSGNEWRQYESVLHRINRNLKKIGKMAGLQIPLTTYVARHSWASAAKSQNIPLATISEGLGHDSVSTTKVYLASLDTSVVDLANRKILRLLK